MEKPVPRKFADLIALWPHDTFAEDLGISAGHVAVMKHRNRVPPLYWSRIVAAAPRRNIEGITFELLERLHRQKKAIAAPSGEAA